MCNWSAIQVLFCDVDGVLTDGSIYFGPEGQVFKRFNVLDGLGINHLVQGGVHVVFISGDDSPIVRARAAKLGVEEVYTGCRDKGRVVEEVLERGGWRREEACYIGDDVLDLPAMRRVGLPVAVPDAHDEVLQVAAYVTRKPGGRGAVREVCDLILTARDCGQS